MQYNQSDFLSELYKAIQAAGFQIKGNIDIHNPNPQRFKDRRKPNKGADLFVIIYGQRGALFGDWHNPDGWVTWWLDGKSRPSVSESLEYQRQRKELEKERQQKRDHASKRAQRFWLNHIVNADIEDNPYVVNKRIRPYFGKSIKKERWLKDLLIVPIRNINYELITIQIIKASGFKRLWKGTSQKDHMIWLSLPFPSTYRGMIRICEGYATGCSIYEAIGDPVICAINANNIFNVVKLLQAKYPLATLIICADNDYWTKDNPGILAAMKTMRETGAMMRYPVFDRFDTSEKPTDYNDLFVLAGIEEVENQLLTQY